VPHKGHKGKNTTY